MFNIFKKKNKVESFWKWFQKNEMELRNFELSPTKTKMLVNSQSKKIAKGLIFEMKPSKNGIINTTISAGGIKTLFPNVEELYHKAPNIEGWKFIKFKQRIPTNKVKLMVLKSDEYELNPNNMRFSGVFLDNKIDINLYIKGLTTESYTEIADGVLFLLDNLLGEYDCVTKINNFVLQEMPSDILKRKTLKPLLKLVDFVDKNKIV